MRKRCNSACFQCALAGKDYLDQGGSTGTWQHFLQTAPWCAWSFKKHGQQSIGKSKGGWNTKLHVVSANDKIIVEMHLSGGNCHDAPQGRVSIEQIGNRYSGVPVLMDRAYEGDKTRELCRSLGHEPVVPPKKNRLNPWEYDHELYKQRNIIERLFRLLKEFRRVCTRYDKCDSIFLSFIRSDSLHLHVVKIVSTGSK